MLQIRMSLTLLSGKQEAKHCVGMISNSYLYNGTTAVATPPQPPGREETLYNLVVSSLLFSEFQHEFGILYLSPWTSKSCHLRKVRDDDHDDDGADYGTYMAAGIGFDSQLWSYLLGEKLTRLSLNTEYIRYFHWDLLWFFDKPKRTDPQWLLRRSCHNAYLKYNLKILASVDDIRFQRENN